MVAWKVLFKCHPVAWKKRSGGHTTVDKILGELPPKSLSRVGAVRRECNPTPNVLRNAKLLEMVNASPSEAIRRVESSESPLTQFR